MEVKLKRAYESPSADDGYRVLVDRLWPRGLSKEKLHVDLWLKEIAPSNDLRQWFGHETSKWEEFRKRYLRELEQNAEAVALFREAVKGRNRVTLVYAARDAEHNEAVVLQAFLSRL